MPSPCSKATVSTTINGGSFEQAVLNSVAADVATLGANMVGQTMDGSTAWNSEGGLLHVLSHATLCCAVASISGNDCAAAAIGAATSAALLPRVGEAMDLTQQDKASPNVQLGMTVLSMMAGGVLAASTGHDPTTAAGAAQNEAVNNYLTPKERATLAQARADCAAAGGNPDSAACMQRDSLMRLDAQRNAGLAQGEYSATQARQWQGQEYQAASMCPPPYQCAANANAVGLEGYWQGKAVGEQGLLPGYDPVDVLLGLSGVYGAGRALAGWAGAGVVRGSVAEGVQGVGEAYNVANATKLADQLTLQSAKSPFMGAGTLTQDAINSADVIRGLGPGRLSNPAIPEGFGKYTTDTFRSPAGDFQMHFYKNPATGEVFYGVDYKAIFNNMSGVPKKP